MKSIQAHRTLREIQQARAALRQARDSTDAVFAVVPFDRWFDRPVPERHRLIFYLGHVEAFDWNLIRCELDLPSPRPSFDSLFAFGIDPTSEGLPVDTTSDWPSVEEVSDYIRDVRRLIDEVVQHLPPVLLHIACEHRLMHAETFTYLLHNLPDPLRPVPYRASASSSWLYDDEEIRNIPSGTATLGQYREPGSEPGNEPGNGRDGFGWDNEFDAHPVYVTSFGIDRYKVTNRRYLAFVEAGALPPHFWRHHGKDWYWRTRNGEIPLPLDWPVYVTQEEATTYARWPGKALPSEAQFHRAAYGTPEGEERAYPWGDGSPRPAHANFGGRCGNPVGVRATPSGESAFGVAQLVGNGWESTSTVFEPFPGFRVHPSYAGYSAPFFDGDHYVLKGGSPVTAAPLLRRSFRNWFRRTYRYAYAAFRCVER